jgi:hypothetical protein
MSGISGGREDPSIGPDLTETDSYESLVTAAGAYIGNVPMCAMKGNSCALVDDFRALDCG